MTRSTLEADAEAVDAQTRRAAGSGRLGSVRAGILLAHALVFAALAWWSWGKWLDPIIDFGRELYVPWQITQGRVLYRDIESLFGPLSPYVNALWFRLFGVSLLTLVVCNLAIFAATVSGIYHLVRLATDRVTATAAGLTALLLFGFSQYVSVANYNYAAPYAHGATHGIALSVALMVCVCSAIASRRVLLWAAAGACFGLLLLTKPETSLAAAAAAGTACIAAALMDGRRARELRRGCVAFAAAAAIPALLFFVYFSAHMPPAEALRAVGGAWTAPFATSVVQNTFYRLGMGTDRPLLNALVALRAFSGLVIYFAVAAAVAWVCGKDAPRPSLVRRALPLMLVMVAAILAPVGTFPSALLFVALTSLAAAGALFAAARRDRARAMRVLPYLVWSVFAVVLLAKIVLNTRISHYGFYLALPATVGGVMLICWLIPQLFQQYGRPAAARTFRMIAVGTLAVAIAPFFAVSDALYRLKSLPVGTSGDRFLVPDNQADWQGRAVHDALDELRSAGPDRTLAVLPEGVTINYLLRWKSPLRVINLMPPELMAFGEDEVLRSLQASPPDFVLLVDKDVDVYGYPPFGTDARYGLRIVEWVRSRYRRVRVIGHAPEAIEILRISNGDS